jgi:peptidoglycan-associated lipoprotein
MSIKHLFFTAFLAAGLAGCSSTPTNEGTENGAGAAEKSVQTEAVGATGSEVSTGAAGNETASSAEDLAAEKAKEAEDKLKQLEAAALGKMVHFDFDKSEIKPEYYDVIKAEADYLAAVPSMSVTVEGHCDERGTREYNLALGERRANAVKNALIAQGISPSRIITISYGEERPLDPRHNEEAWAKNRRAEFKFQK